MGIFGGWILSIIGIVLIGVIVDLILPDGEMQKYIKSIFLVFVVFVMINPILNFNIDKIDFNKFIYNSSSVEINENFLINYNKEYKKSLEKVCEASLENKGFKNVIVTIYLNMSTTKFEIKQVELNLKNLVINENSVHIDKYKEIKSIILSLLDIEENRVVFKWVKKKRRIISWWITCLNFHF